MLSFAEEIYLLVLDDTTGELYSHADEISLSYALVGATLCELSFMRKIDSDIERLIVIDKIPTGNKILDSILNLIAEAEAKMPVSYWLKVLLSSAVETEDLVISELINKGIVKMTKKETFWGLHKKRYHIVNNNEVNNIEAKIRYLVLNEGEIPEPRDAALISLIQACNLFETIFSPRELQRVRKRIHILVKLDIIGREVVEMISEIENFSPRIFTSKNKRSIKKNTPFEHNFCFRRKR